MSIYEDEFPDCMFCGPCRCDDECDCVGGICVICGHISNVMPDIDGYIPEVVE